MPGKDPAAARRLLFQRPQVNLSRSAAARMWLIAACAFLAVLQSSFTDSFASLTVAMSALAAAMMSELLCSLKRGGLSLGDGSAAASALILTLLLPNHIHPLAAALGASFAMIAAKYSFGGLGSNWVNPALAGWLFIRLSWPAAFSAALDGSPLLIFPGNPKAGEFIRWAAESASGPFPDTLAQGIAEFLNKTVFFVTRAELPGGYLGLFLPSSPGIIADRGLFALLLGTILITASQVSRFWIPLLFLGAYAFLVRCFGALPAGGGFGGGDLFFGLFSGGIIAGAFLLAADPVTGPKSRPGMAAASLAGGILAFLLRYWGLEPYGAFFALALLNALMPLFRDIESRWFYEKWRASAP
jgi:electron transport complex protein RnfD